MSRTSTTVDKLCRAVEPRFQYLGSTVPPLHWKGPGWYMFCITTGRRGEVTNFFGMHRKTGIKPDIAAYIADGFFEFARKESFIGVRRGNDMYVWQKYA